MQELFGALSPLFVISIVSALIQWIKSSYPELTRRKIHLIALAVNFVFIFPFSLLTASAINYFSVFAAFIYSISAWLMTIGFYEAALNRKNYNN